MCYDLGKINLSNMIKIPTDPFSLERLRARLALSGRHKELIKTYSREMPEIKDLNTPRLWDSLNVRSKINRQTDPMAYNRLIVASGFVPAGMKKLLNIGVGACDIESIVLTRHRDVEWFGIDISPGSIKRAKIKFPKASFKRGSIDGLEFGNSFFDGVVILEVLEHIRPRKIFKSLGEVKRVMKRGGKLIVSVPLSENLEEMVKAGKNPNAHVRVYTPKLIETELKIAGFRVLKKQFLFAFKSHYKLKSFVCRYIVPGYREPNNIILLAEK